MTVCSGVAESGDKWVYATLITFPLECYGNCPVKRERVEIDGQISLLLSS